MLRFPKIQSFLVFFFYFPFYIFSVLYNKKGYPQ